MIEYLDVLLGAMIFFIAQGYKKIDAKYGDEASKNVLLILAFTVSVIFAIIIAIYNGTYDYSITTTKYLLETGVTIFGNAIVIYEVAYKRIVIPAISLARRVL
jgi:hypothetical protein